MQHNQIKVKIYLTLFVLGVIIWLGGSIIRTSVAYDIYIPATELQLKQEYTDSMRILTVRLFAMAALYTEIAFSVSFICAVALMIILRKQLKTRGWLFMSFILFFIAVPLELYLMVMDIKLNLAFYSRVIMSFEDSDIQNFFVMRFRKFNVMSPLTYLLVVSSCLTLVWRPLDKLKK